LAKIIVLLDFFVEKKHQSVQEFNKEENEK